MRHRVDAEYFDPVDEDGRSDNEYEVDELRVVSQSTERVDGTYSGPNESSLDFCQKRKDGQERRYVDEIGDAKAEVIETFEKEEETKVRVDVRRGRRLHPRFDSYAIPQKKIDGGKGRRKQTMHSIRIL